MEFKDLKTQYMHHKEAIDGAIAKTVASAQFIGGEPVTRLEKQLAEYVGVKHCISCANGTDALLLGLMAWGVGEGDAVFVPDFTFFSTAEVVPWTGATPVFVDIDADTFNMSPQALEEAVAGVKAEGRLKPRAVIAVDLFGQPAEYEKIRRITQEQGLLLLEDGAQGFGGRIGEKRACSFGDISTTSFFPVKPLGCYGDGGAVFTDNDEWAQLVRSFKVHGKGEDKYDNIRLGMNSRLDTIQAAVLLPKLKAFQDYELEKVNLAAEMYYELLKDMVKVPCIPEEYDSSWAQYTIQLKNQADRDGLQSFLKQAGIPTMIYYPIPMDKQKAFDGIKKYQECPVTEKLCQTVLSLPIHPYMEDASIKLVADTIKNYFS